MTLVRPAVLADTISILRLEEQAFTSDRMSRRSIRRLIKSQSAKVLVADDGTEVAAAAVVLFRRATRSARIYSIAVDLRHRGKGIASKLLASAEACAHATGACFLRLEVREGNQVAERLYRKRGYTGYAIYPCYYSDGANAIRMEKQLMRVPK